MTVLCFSEGTDDAATPVRHILYILNYFNVMLFLPFSLPCFLFLLSALTSLAIVLHAYFIINL